MTEKELKAFTKSPFYGILMPQVLSGFYGKDCEDLPADILMNVMSCCVRNFNADGRYTPEDVKKALVKYMHDTEDEFKDLQDTSGMFVNIVK